MIFYDFFLAAGHLNIKTSAPVNHHQQTEIDQRLKPTLGTS